MSAPSTTSNVRRTSRRRAKDQRRRQQQQIDKKARRGLRVSSDDVEDCSNLCRDLGYHIDPDLEIGWQSRREHTTPSSRKGSDNNLLPSILDSPATAPHVNLPERRLSIPSPLLYHQETKSVVPTPAENDDLAYGQKSPKSDFKTYKGKELSESGVQATGSDYLGAFSQPPGPCSPTLTSHSIDCSTQKRGVLFEDLLQTPHVRSRALTVPTTPKKRPLKSPRLSVNELPSLPPPSPIRSPSASSTPDCFALLPLDLGKNYTQTILDWLRAPKADCGLGEITSMIEWIADDLGMDEGHSTGCDWGKACESANGTEYEYVRELFDEDMEVKGDEEDDGGWEFVEPGEG
ncbi:MAG: hypothetical protein Q9227_002862 [Pyrenula ochraceoflavens]